MTRTPSKHTNGNRLHGPAKAIAKKRALCARALHDLEGLARRRPPRSGGVIRSVLEARMDDIRDELGGRWRFATVLKRDVFSAIERGRFRTESGEVDAVLRRLDGVPRWSRPLAYELFRRERKALTLAKPLGVAPPLLFAGRRLSVRGWIDGVPLHIGKPYGDARLFPLGEGGIAQAPSRRHRPRRSRQGTELALADRETAARF